MGHCIFGVVRQCGYAADTARSDVSFREYPEENGITENADAHPVMRQFHKSGDEKRMIVILPESA